MKNVDFYFKCHEDYSMEMTVELESCNGKLPDAREPRYCSIKTVIIVKWHDNNIIYR